MIQIFGTPIYQFKVPIHSQIKTKFEQDSKDGWFKRIWKNSTGSTTFNSENLKGIGFINEIESVVWTHFDLYLAQIQTLPWIRERGTSSSEYVLRSTWINKYLNGEEQEIHNHLNASFSWLYFLQQPKEGGSKMYMYNTNSRNDDRQLGLSNRFKPQQKEGDLVIFPAYLNHFVTTNESKEARYTVAGNIKFRGDLKLSPREKYSDDEV